MAGNVPIAKVGADQQGTFPFFRQITEMVFPVEIKGKLIGIAGKDSHFIQQRLTESVIAKIDVVQRFEKGKLLNMPEVEIG